jgi:hypothetical protein
MPRSPDIERKKERERERKKESEKRVRRKSKWVWKSGQFVMCIAKRIQIRLGL